MEDNQERFYELVFETPEGDPFGAEDERITALVDAGIHEFTPVSRGPRDLRLCFSGDLSMAKTVEEIRKKAEAALPDCRFKGVVFDDPLD